MKRCRAQLFLVEGANNRRWRRSDHRQIAAPLQEERQQGAGHQEQRAQVYSHLKAKPGLEATPPWRQCDHQVEQERQSCQTTRP